METLARIVGFIFSFKAYVMLPAIILVVALVIRMRVGQSLLSALRLGVGFAGIFIAFGFFVQQIAPAVSSLVKMRGLDFPVLDVGWPPLAAITWASAVAPLSIPLVLLLNLALLALNLTRTINITRILELAVNVAAVMFILPHCGALIGKAMEPVSLQLKGIIQRRFPKKTVLYVGMDSGVIMGNSSVIVPYPPSL